MMSMTCFLILTGFSLFSDACNVFSRCGYEFCYNCGAEWKDKKATCSCPLWDEDNILYAANDTDFDEDDFDEDEDDYEDDYYDSDSDGYVI